MQTVDLYTAYHKGLRRKLFAFSVHLGRVNWNRADQLDALRAQWDTLLLRLDRHGAHEEQFIHPLFANFATDLCEALEAEHEAHDAALAALSAALRRAADTPDADAQRLAGLDAYRAYQRFLAEYLLHLDREECAAMPLIQRYASAEDALAAQLALQRSLAPDEALDSIASMLGALPDDDARQLTDKVRQIAPTLLDAATRRVEHEAVLG
jgi:iron-sulfur cluster repair protein YtfE (RIC family)